MHTFTTTEALSATDLEILRRAQRLSLSDKEELLRWLAPEPVPSDLKAKGVQETCQSHLDVHLPPNSENLALAALSALFRYGRIDYFDAFLFLQECGQSKIFTRPQEYASDSGRFNFALPFNNLFIRKMAIEYLRDGRFCKNWPSESLGLPHFDVIRKNADCEHNASLRVVSIERGTFTLEIKNERAIDCHLLDARRTLFGDSMPPYAKCTFPERGKTVCGSMAAFIVDPENLDLIVAVGRGLKELNNRYKKTDLERLLYQATRWERRVRKAMETLEDLYLFARDQMTQRKLNLHFPSERMSVKFKQWQRLAQQLADIQFELRDAGIQSSRADLLSALHTFLNTRDLNRPVDERIHALVVQSFERAWDHALRSPDTNIAECDAELRRSEFKQTLGSARNWECILLHQTWDALHQDCVPTDYESFEKNLRKKVEKRLFEWIQTDILKIEKQNRTRPISRSLAKKLATAHSTSPNFNRL